MATVSLLITYYNEKELLTECLLSAYQQTVLPDQIMVYDDASPFPAKDYIPFHPTLKIKVIRGEKNIMVSGARNELMKNAETDYVHFQDADDLLEPHCFEVIKKHIDNNPTELIINEVRSINFDTKDPISNAVMSLHTLSANKDLVKYAIEGSLLAPSTTFKKSLGLKLGGYKSGKLLQCEDYEFNIRLVFYSKEYQVITQPLIIQRLRTNSMSCDKQELYVEGIKALRYLLAELPATYHRTIAERASKMGRILFQQGFHKDAKNAFDFASEIYSAPYNTENLFYKSMCSVLGQYNAEKIALKYRKLIPKKFREKLSY